MSKMLAKKSLLADNHKVKEYVKGSVLYGFVQNMWKKLG